MTFFQWINIMTRSKIEFATILASLRKDGSDPQKLASEMSLRKLCYEIERLEQEAEDAKAAAPKRTPPPKEKGGGKPFWAWLTQDSSDDD
jgi:hypothetical protein